MEKDKPYPLQNRGIFTGKTDESQVVQRYNLFAIKRQRFGVGRPMKIQKNLANVKKWMIFSDL